MFFTVFTNKQKKLIQNYFQHYIHQDNQFLEISNAADCKIFMFNLEQNLAFKSPLEELNNDENQLFYTLLSNNNLESDYPTELVNLFQEILGYELQS